MATTPVKMGLNLEIAEFKQRRIVEEAVNLFYFEGYENTTLDIDLNFKICMSKEFFVKNKFNSF